MSAAVVADSSAAVEGTACPNCTGPVKGRYCPACGQQLGDLNVSVGHWFAEFLEEELSIGGKLPRSLRALLLRPGLLTVEWLRGRRAGYVAPVRLYLGAAILFFSFLALSGADVDMAEGVAAGYSEARDTGDQQGSDQVSATVMRDVFQMFPRAMLLALPVFALMLRALFPGAGIYYIGHLVFSLHTQAFIFLSSIILIPVMGLTGPGEIAALGILFSLLGLMCAYIFRALRVVYRESWPRTAAKGVLLIGADVAVRLAVTVVLTLFLT